MIALKNKNIDLLTSSIEDGNIEDVIKIIKQDIKINSKNSKDQTPLELAIKARIYTTQIKGNGAKRSEKLQKNLSEIADKHTKITEILLDNGANPNTRDENGKFLFFIAIESDQLDLIKMFLKHHVNTNLKAVPLFYAIENNNLELVKLLLQYNAHVNVKNKYYGYPLEFAIKKDNINIVKLLLEKGAYTNIKNEYNTNNILFDAISKNKSELVKILLEHKAKTNIKDEYGNTPLSIAVKKNNTEIVRALLKHEAKVNIKNKDGDTPLSIAVEENNTEIVKTLLEYGAKVNATKIDSIDDAPLFKAIGYKNIEIVNELLNHGGDTNFKVGFFRKVLLICEIIILNIKIKFTLKETKNNRKFKINLDFNNFCRNCLLEKAVIRDSIEIVKMLFERGADINFKNEDGNSLLHTAAREGSKNVLEFLLTKGINVNIKNLSFQTPLYFIVYSLESPLTKINDLFDCVRPLFINSTKADFDLIMKNVIISKTKDILECAQLLLKYGANIDSKDKIFGSVLKQIAFYIGLLNKDHNYLLDFIELLLANGTGINKIKNAFYSLDIKKIPLEVEKLLLKYETKY